MKVILVIRKFYNRLRKFDWYMYVMKMAAERTHQFGKEKTTEITDDSLSN